MAESPSTAGAAPLPSSSAPPPLQPLLVDGPEAARLLSISERLLWTLTSTGKIPHLRLGNRLLYPVERLRAWVQEQAQGGDE